MTGREAGSRRPARGAAVGRANVLGYCTTGALGWLLTLVMAIPLTAFMAGWAYVTEGIGLDLADLAYSVRRETRRIAQGRTRTLLLRTWFPEPTGRQTASWVLSNEGAVIGAGTVHVTLAVGGCVVTIVSCPLTRFGRARAKVDNGEITLGVVCRPREMELLARVLQWQTMVSAPR